VRYIQGIAQPPVPQSEGSHAIDPATNQALCGRDGSYWKRLDEIDWEGVPAGDQCRKCREVVYGA
jgi:hypothetical protein